MKIVDHRKDDRRVPIRDLPDGTYFADAAGIVGVILGRDEDSIQTCAADSSEHFDLVPSALVTPLIVHHVEELHIDGEGRA